MAEEATIRIDGRHSPLAWLLYFTKLTIEIDGMPQRGSWGDRAVSVPPGRHEVKVFFKYIAKARCCEGATTVDAGAGQTVTMKYRPPMLMTARGRLTVIG